jgi:hypothetical protein
VGCRGSERTGGRRIGPIRDGVFAAHMGLWRERTIRITRRKWGAAKGKKEVSISGTSNEGADITKTQK